MFAVGETVVHPAYGAGVVIDIKAITSLGSQKRRYYSIELLSQPETTVMVAVNDEEKVGLRSPVSEPKLNRIWRIFCAGPATLPSDHNKRYDLLAEKLHNGDILEIAEVLRDLAWRKENRRSLTIRGKRLYDESLELLASELAGAHGSDFEMAEAQISDRLAASLADASVGRDTPPPL
jgi:RNA polymerase-interacting CarD/CdnL/TRCF family regulator